MRLTLPNDGFAPGIPMTYDVSTAGKNGVIIAAILDESGSMSPYQMQTISAFNEFIDGQKAAGSEAGKGFLTLVKFDAPEVKLVFQNRPLETVEPLTTRDYEPRGGTNLFDAIGETIGSLNSALRSKPVSERPGVIMLIMTDGEENSSRRFNSHQVRELVRAAEKSDWTFTFLGANIDAFKAGAQIGMGHYNTMNFAAGAVGATMAAVGETVTQLRGGKMAGMNTADLYAKGFYDDKARDKAMGG
jgi:hypothetical protein